MRAWRCKCGNAFAFGSDAPQPCTRCSKCGSDLAGHPDHHREPIPHRFITKYNENTGEPYEICNRCWQKKSYLEKYNEL